MLKRIISLLMALLIIISACACSSEGKKETKADDFSLTNVTSYEEKEIGAAIGFQYPGMKVCLDSKDQIILNDFREKESFCILADGSGKKLQEYKNATTNGILFTLDAQDNRYVIDEKYSTEKEVDTSREITYTLIIYNSNGEKQKSFDLGKRTFTDKQPGITDIAVDTKGTVYLLLRRQNIEVIGSDGKKIKDIPAAKTDYIEMDEEDNLLIGSFDGINSHSSIEKRNPEKANNIWTKEFAVGNYMREMKYSQSNKKLYMITDKGVLSCSSDGNIEGFILDLKQSSLLKSEIYISDFVFDSNKNIYILASKSDSSSGTYKSTPLFYKYTPMKENQKPKNQKTLTLAARYSDRFLDAAISKFQGEHPDIKVEVKDYSAANMGTSEDERNRAKKAEDDYQKVISTELMAGKGADIIEIEGLPYKKFIDKNALANMSEMIKNDSSFDLRKYQQSLLNACKYKDNLYTMPINFIFDSFMANKKIINKEGLNIDSTKWTWKEFLSIAQKITKDENGDGKPDQYALPKMSVERIFMNIFQGEYSNFIDIDKKTAHFDSEEFIEILNFAKDFSSKGVCSPTLDQMKLFDYTDPGTIGFMRLGVLNYFSIGLNQSIFNAEVEYLDVPSYSGKRNPKLFMQGRIFAINNNSELQAEAWEFIKLLLSDEVQSNTDMQYFAVNLKALKEQANQNIQMGVDYFKQMGRDVKPLTQSDIDIFNKKIGEITIFEYSDTQADKIVSDGVKEFFSGKKTAEESAKLIQNKMNIYLGE